MCFYVLVELCSYYFEVKFWEFLLIIKVEGCCNKPKHFTIFSLKAFKLPDHNKISITMSLGCQDYIVKQLLDLVNPSLNDGSLSLWSLCLLSAYLQDFFFSLQFTQALTFLPGIYSQLQTRHFMDIVRVKPSFH